MRDGIAYVLLQSADAADPRGNGIVRIDLASGTTRRLADLPRLAVDLAADADGLVATGTFGAIALTFDGNVRWAWTPEPIRASRAETGCYEPMRGDAWYITCTEFGLAVPETGYRTATSFVAALSPSHGTVAWTSRLGNLTAPADPQAFAADPVTPATPDTYAGYMGLFGSTIVLQFVEETARSIEELGALTRFAYVGIDAHSGQQLWMKATPYSNRATPHATPALPLRPPAGSGPTGDANIVYVKVDANVVALNARQGTTIWTAPIRQMDFLLDYGWVAFAFQDGELIAPAAQTVTSFDVRTQESPWTYVLPTEWQGIWTLYDTVVVDSAVYLGAHQVGPGYEDDQAPNSSIVALDRMSGELSWSFDAPIQPGVVNRLRFAVDGGLMVVTDSTTGNVSVLGRTPLSLGLRSTVSSLSPQPGEALVVDLSGTTPGSSGPPTAFRIDWGDGSPSAWQESPRFEHTYADAGETQARFFARNAAGQSASAPALLDVGAPRLSFLQTAFAPDNQNLTFFAIGATMTVLGALFGFMRLRRGRGILHREMDALNAAYEGTQANPATCELVLSERRARAHVLFREGRLDEARFGVLERRIEHLQRQVRTAVLDERFDFLPRGIARKLEQLLADGTVTAWESKAFEAILRTERLLTASQKEQVRRLVAGWSQRDAASDRA